jgi:hypothetical protein
MGLRIADSSLRRRGVWVCLLPEDLEICDGRGPGGENKAHTSTEERRFGGEDVRGRSSARTGNSIARLSGGTIADSYSEHPHEVSVQSTEHEWWLLWPQYILGCAMQLRRVRGRWKQV